MAKELQNKEFAAAYLSESLRDEKDLTMFLYALRRIIDARGSKMTAVAKKSGLTRESLYKMLSEKGNPKMSSIQAVLDALGFRFQIAG